MNRLLPQIFFAIAGWLFLLASPVCGQTILFDPVDAGLTPVAEVESSPPPVRTHTVTSNPAASPPVTAGQPLTVPDPAIPSAPPAGMAFDVAPAAPAAVPPSVPLPAPPTPPPSPSPAPAPAPPPIADHAPAALSPAPNLFAGGSDSLVARVVGHAEGTRTAAGSRTRAYEGHTDPGNGVWNLGSFSFQHCQAAAYNCATPEQADVHQLRRLEGQAEQLRQRATALGLTLTLEEELNGIDLANQAPLAALGTPEAYPEQLARAKQRGLTGQTAILEGRIWSFWDTTTGQWDAPGLGNSESNIRHDQHRRMQAIARALAAYQQQQGQAERVADQIIDYDRSAAL